MQMKKCNALIGRFLFIGMVLVSAVLTPINFGRVEASAKSGEIGSMILGDVNNDGDVNSIDFAYMKMNLLGIKGSLLNDENIFVADLNGDGKFDSIDLAIMKGYLLGKIKEFPIGQSIVTPMPAVPTPKPTVLPSPTKSSGNDDFTNDISKASYLVSVGEEVRGKIDYAGDEDYMLFIPPNDGRYRVEIYTNVETSIAYLYTEKIEGLKYYYNSFGTYTSKEGYYYIQENLTGGTKYVLGVKNRKDKVSLDSYVIKISKLN
ncbi:dockerin type I repeat-containing protein [Acetivibrio clariflavus]|uniref:Dockerin-like protein n=1 Tax=Acetivibrio clariflavus (strain DSM 19732 / NBRC 101661 / EBR45) TaxID=720554 RepID=G8M1W9_ACECE|nr:dockerin type I repeat-containing protein [Acetivibrio clariflavus]AEV67052.1 dockerin-like protein [Acetivibrio clariflavus DSM 19732]